MTNYQSTLESYTQELRGMFAPVSADGEFAPPARRGAAAPDAQTLTERAERLAALGQELGRQHAEYLSADRQAVREGAEIKLLAQINADLAVASALLETAEQEAGTAAFGGEERPRRRTRSATGAATTRALDALAAALEAPLEEGAQAFTSRRRGAMRGTRPANQADACKALGDKTKTCLRRIVSQAALTSSEALDTLLSLDGEMLGKAVGLVSKEAGEALDKVAAGATALIKRIITTAAALLLQAYDLVLSLLGKDTESAARKKVQEWVEELRGEHKQGADKEGLAGRLVNRIYAADGVETDVNGWLAKTEAGHEAINDTTDAVDKLAGAYEVKAKQVKDTLGVVRVARGIARGAALKFPPVATALPYLELLAGAVTAGLLGYTLYTGYDHVDSGQAVFFERFAVKIPERVEGIRRVTKKVLVKE